MDILREKGCLIPAVVIAMLCVFQLRQCNSPEALEKKVARLEGWDMTTAKRSERIKEAQRNHYKQPKLALEKLEQVLADPEDDVEVSQAQDMMPAVLNYLFNSELKIGNENSAVELLDRMRKEFPEHFQTRSTIKTWGDHLGKALQEAVRNEDDLHVRNAVTQLSEVSGYQVHDYIVKILHDFYAKKASDAYVDGRRDDMHDDLHYVTSFMGNTDWGYSLSRALESGEIPGNALYRIANEWYEKGELPRALPLYIAAYSTLNRKGWRKGADSYEQKRKFSEEIRGRVFECQMNVAKKIEVGIRPGIFVISTPLDYYYNASRMSEVPAQRVEALTARINYAHEQLKTTLGSLLEKDLRWYTRRENWTYEQGNEMGSAFYKARADFNSAADKDGRAIWQALSNEPDFNPSRYAHSGPKKMAWEAVPESGRVKERARALEKVYREAYWPLPAPGIQDIEETGCQLYARWGILNAHSSRRDMAEHLNKAFIWSRDLLLKEQILDALEALLARSVEGKDFETFYEIAVYYSGCPGVENRDAFRPELFTLLDAAEKHFARQSSMKHLFTLTLQAELFPETDAGKRAAKESIANAFKQVGGMSESDSGAPVSGSGIPSFSAVAVDNSTDYHILCFYRGPETFPVRIPPRTRGTVMMQNGTYEIAVLCTEDDVQPYRAKMKADSGVFRSVYKVVTSNQQTYSGSSAWGDYVILRAPGNMPSVSVDRTTGHLRL